MAEKEIPADADLTKLPTIGTYKQNPEVAEAYGRAVRIIDQMATIEPEARHGRWIVKGQEIYCSECNGESLYNPFGASKFSRFCPNCGARMEIA